MGLKANQQRIVFGAGCFWGVQKYFSSLEGVITTRVGYAGGNYPNPDYKKVLSYRYSTPSGVKNYTEAVEVIYNDSLISTEKLIKSFWELHDPTQKDRQGNDIGNNYRSAIYYTTQEQKIVAFNSKREYQKLLTDAGFGEIQTEIEPLKSFYKAEEYHQNYLLKNPHGYCPNHSTGIKFKKNEDIKKIDNITPKGGKEIVIVESDGCPYCEKLKTQVLSSYRGSIPLRVVKESRLKKLNLKGKIEVTPTILFIEDGKEIFRVKGYLNREDFYRLVPPFKLR